MIAPSVGPEAKVLPFRRRQRVVRIRRRSLAARLARPVAQALLLVGAPVALVAWVLTSPSFALADVQVEGTAHVPAHWVRTALAPLHGRNLPLLALADATARVGANPWVASLEVDKLLPSRLRVRVVEKVPAALLRRGHELLYLDAAAAVIAPYDAERGPHDLLLVTVAPGADRALGRLPAFTAELANAAPPLARQLSEVAVLGDGDYRVHSAALPFPVLLREGDLGPRLARLRDWLPLLERHYPALGGVDLRFSRRIILNPRGAPPDGETPDDRLVRS